MSLSQKLIVVNTSLIARLEGEFMNRKLIGSITIGLCLMLVAAGCYEGGDPKPQAAGTATGVAPVQITPDETLQGHLDVADCTGVYGWAHDTDAPGRRVDVNIYNGGRKIATVKADGFREDLAVAGKDDGSVMFAFPLPDSMKDSRDRPIRVIVENGKSLTPNPIVVNCPAS